MKKLYLVFCAALAILAVTSCSLKEDNNFGTPAAQRSQENMAEVKRVLTSAANGWVMEYYGDLDFGGYNILLKFEGDQVTVASEKWGSSHKAGIDADGNVITSTSHYKLEQSMGTVISLDEFNETFHYYTMPNNPDYTYDAQNGLSGDFEYRVMVARADSVILRGKRNNNRVVMTPAPADKTWAELITAADDTEKYMTSRNYTLSGEGRTGERTINAVNNGYRCLIFSYKDDKDETVQVQAPFIVKSDGFYFYTPVTVDGMVLDGLVKGDTDDYFVFRNNPKLQLDTYMPTLAESIVTGLWYQRYGDVGEYAKPYWDALLQKLKTAGRNKKEVKIYTSTIGYANKRLATNLSTDADAPYWGFTAQSLEDGSRIKFNQNSTVKNTAGTKYRGWGWDKVLNCVYGHTFDLTCDHQRRPTWIKMTDVDNPTNVITLYATPCYFMEDTSYYQENN